MSAEKRKVMMENRDIVPNTENTLDLVEITKQLEYKADVLMASKMSLLEEKIESKINAIKVELYDTIIKAGNFWISVKDRLPIEDGRYEVCFEASELSARVCGRLYFLNGQWVQDPCTFHLDIIYWMPLPVPPED